MFVYECGVKTQCARVMKANKVHRARGNGRMANSITIGYYLSFGAPLGFVFVWRKLTSLLPILPSHHKP